MGALQGPAGFPPQSDKLKPLQATVLGVFGEEDKGIPPKAVHEFEAALKKANKKVYKIKEFKAGRATTRICRRRS